jgi:hypothetical protein
MPAAKEGVTLADFISKFTTSTGQFMPRNKYGKPQKPEGAKVEETKPEVAKVAEKVSEKTSKEPSYERRRH